MTKKILFCLLSIVLIFGACKDKEKWENPMSLSTSDGVPHKIDIQQYRYRTFLVRITGGTGELVMESSNPQAVTVFLENRILYYTPIALGANKITIKDEEGQTKELEVIVEGDDSLDPRFKNYGAIGETKVYDIKEHGYPVYFGSITAPDLVDAKLVNNNKQVSIKFLKRGRTIVHVLGENPEGNRPVPLSAETFYIYEPNEIYREDEKVDYEGLSVGQLISPLKLYNGDGIFVIENTNPEIARATIVRVDNNYPEVKFDFLKVGNTSITIKDGSGRFVKFNLNVTTP